MILLDEIEKAPPESLNRVDEMVVFHALTRSQLREIVDLQAESLKQMLAERELALPLTAAARDALAGEGCDPQFGALIMFGLGGIYVEVLKDVAFRIAPITEGDADEMIREIRSFPLLRGVRGEKPADLAAAKDALLRLSQLVTSNPDIVELDINPLSLFAEGQGAVAIDARLTIGGN